MPSPRSILIDIETHGLDPSVPHSNIGGGGNLRPVKADVVEVEKTSVEESIRNGLVELASEPLTGEIQIDVQMPEIENQKRKLPKKPKKLPDLPSS